MADHIYLTYIAYVAAFILLCFLGCSREAAKNYPTNLILLFTFTICFSFVIALIVGCYDVQSVVMALGLTAGITLGLTLAAWFV